MTTAHVHLPSVLSRQRRVGPPRWDAGVLARMRAEQLRARHRRVHPDALREALEAAAVDLEAAGR